MTKPAAPTQLLTIKRTADLCDVSLKTIRRWIAAKELPAIRLGSLWRIRPHDLEIFLRDHLSR